MKASDFSIEKVNKLTKEMAKNSIIPYSDLPQYDLFLSQVIDYLNDRFENENYTNNIVQNYIKNEVISKPEDGRKRGYTKLHLAQLALLSYMRPILTTDEIKKVFRLAFNEINDRSDDIISWEKAYKIFCDIQEKCFDSFVKSDYFDEAEISSMIKDINLKSKNDEKRIEVFLIVMTLIAQAGAIKKLAQKIVDEYGNEN
ncbi:hypothetical protein CLTEP_18930 [Clostridium tepidiprofundi DSM 19306]|uniref:DUF1836 domain-containing protein n=2 Tax=Clostridium TaxID=1485 RepID=A0A151B2M1_9CLOT|nr:DUF1836 domain-containing protein [Clostridium tepidiprofundi]KYH34179.1 hypothetical protein CLTEP_18930 [Clostridium tepidiprofundi DSM 19306]